MATMKTLAEDTAPVVQAGLISDLNGRKYVRWTGRVSELVAADGAAAVKLVPGFRFTDWAVSAKPLTDPVGVYGTGAELASGVSVALVATQKTEADDGTLTDTDGGLSVSGVAVKGPTAAGGDDATYGLVASGALASPKTVEDDAQFVALTATATGTALSRLGNDCLVEVRFYAEQVDPAPLKMH